MSKESEERFASIVEESRRELKESTRDDLPHIFIGMATCGLAAGAAETKAAFEEALAECRLAARITPVGCLGHCYAEPLVAISNPGFPRIYYHQVTTGKARALVRSFLGEGDPLFEYMLGAAEENDLITVINNVKTLSTVPSIVRHGAEWYRAIGTESSPGTAIFSVVGKVVHPGLVEIPTGTTLRTLIFDTCGGIPKRKRFKAVQIGGPSGGCLPESFLDTPVDFDSLVQAGAMMGSGVTRLNREERSRETSETNLLRCRSFS